jgi:hypothetical protein
MKSAEHLTKEEWHQRVALLYGEVWGSCSVGGVDSLNQRNQKDDFSSLI